MAKENLVMVIAYDLVKSNETAFKDVKRITDVAIAKGYKVIGMSASGNEKTNTLIKKHKFNFEFYFNDETTLKTIVRSNPAILVLDKGTILQKAHYKDLNKIKF